MSSLIGTDFLLLFEMAIAIYPGKNLINAIIQDED